MKNKKLCQLVALFVLCFLPIDVYAQMVFSNLDVYHWWGNIGGAKGLKFTYKVTSDKPIKKWNMYLTTIDVVGDPIWINSIENNSSVGDKYVKRILMETGPFNPQKTYTWKNNAIFMSDYKFSVFPHQINIIYMDNTVETIYVRKDNFKTLFPKSKWIDVNYGNLSIIEENPFMPSENQAIVEENNMNPPVSVTPDVDVNIPDLKLNNPNTFAVIIANENYQEEGVPNVEYAIKDGEVFKQYCHKVLGLPEKNIHLRTDATKNNIVAEISWMQQVAKSYGGKARFLIFYAGHGVPDEKTGASYLLPVDALGTEMETAYSLAQFYQKLAAMPAASITVFMDACFSGSKRGDGMLTAARGVAVKAKAPVPQGKMVVFSAAQGDETAYPYKEKGHGLFTYFLLKKLQDTNGNCTYSELADYIRENVSQQSIVANRKSQTPSVMSSASVSTSWRNMKLK